MANYKKPRNTRPQPPTRTVSSGTRHRGVLKPPRETTVVSDTDPCTAQSFLPFCANCEKQIAVSNSSILFCSEKCRRNDQASSPPAIPVRGFRAPGCNSGYGITPPLSSYDMSDYPLSMQYAEPLYPTPPRSTPGFDEFAVSRSLASLALSSEDLRSASGSTSPTPEFPSALSTSNSNLYQPFRRPQHLRSMTSSSSTPTLANMGNSRTNGAHAVPTPTHYQYEGQRDRPLPPLHRLRAFSTSPRSIDLVTPCVSSTSSPPRCDPVPPNTRNNSIDLTSMDHLRYQMKSAGTSSTLSAALDGSLKTLFNFDAIRGEPYVAEPLATSRPDVLTYSNGAAILTRMSPTAVKLR